MAVVAVQALISEEAWHAMLEDQFEDARQLLLSALPDSEAMVSPAL